MISLSLCINCHLVLYEIVLPLNMAEFDDIEYEGIGEDRHIVVGSERCFRDYSPGDTIISLSDNGQNL